jgi:hypothetical protein
LQSAIEGSCFSSFSVVLVRVFADTMATPLWSNQYTIPNHLHNHRGRIYPILAHYFTNVDTAGRVFVNVNVTILPRAMEWIGRDCLLGSRPCTLYFVAMPWIPLHSSPILISRY